MEKLNILRHFLTSKWRHFDSRAQFDTWQHAKLKHHLEWTCQHSPFYREYRGQPLSMFPVMSKQRMMTHFNEINTLGLDRDQLLEIATQAEQTRQFNGSKLKGVTVGLSSGTSGQRGLFLASNQERQEWTGTILAKMLPTPFQAHRIALLLRANSPLYQSVNRGRYKFHYVDLTHPMRQWLDALETFQPTVLVGSAQALQLCAAHSHRLNPSLIISGAEVLTPSDRQLIEQRFNCPVKEIYQCTEGFLACTQPDGTLCWNEDLVHIEPHWLNPEKTHFSPIITDFRRRTQPIIRYLLDDVIEAGHNTPGIFQSIKSIAGRSGDQLHLPGHNEKVTVLSDLIYRAITLASTEPLDYRIHQTAEQQIRIESDAEHILIEHALRRLFDQLEVSPNIHYEHAPRPNWTPSEKQRRVINSWTY